MAQNATLLSLPAEIYRRIFGYILVVPKDKVVRDVHTKNRCDGCDFANNSWQRGETLPTGLCHQGPVPTELLKVCKSLNPIATAVLFYDNKFSFVSIQSFNQFVKQIGRLARQNLRNVVIKFPTNTSFHIRHLQNLVLSTPLDLYLETIELKIPDRRTTPPGKKFTDSIYRFAQGCLADRGTGSTKNEEIAEATMKQFRLQLEYLTGGERFFWGMKVLGNQKGSRKVSLLRLTRFESGGGEKRVNYGVIRGWLKGIFVLAPEQA